MSKKNEILEEQRKARQQYLELKKMQQGDMETPPKPSEEAKEPKTFGEKCANIWLYYKWYIICTILAAAIIIFSVSECVNSVKPDIGVVVFSYNAMAEAQTNAISDYMEGICEDINGDGEVYVSVINCSYDPEQNDGQYEYTILNKLQATLAADYDSLLFITDTESYKYFESDDSMKGLFVDDPTPFSESLYEKLSTEQAPFIGEGMQISCRSYYGTVLEKDKDIKPIYEQSLKIIDKIAIE